MKGPTILLAIVLLFSCQYKKPQIIKTGQEGNLMPTIDLIAFDSLTHFITTNSDPGKPTILFAFQPGCPYCRAQTRAMTSNIKQLKDVNIYMLCMGDYPSFKKYVEKYELNKYPNIKAGIDYKMTFADYYNVATVPYIAIYDKNKKLKQVLQGKNYVSTLKDIALQ
jgi:thiol-disulfide isomerase/thioredoxin